VCTFLNFLQFALLNLCNKNVYDLTTQIVRAYCRIGLHCNCVCLYMDFLFYMQLSTQIMLITCQQLLWCHSSGSLLNNIDFISQLCRNLSPYCGLPVGVLVRFLIWFEQNRLLPASMLLARVANIYYYIWCCHWLLAMHTVASSSVDMRRLGFCRDVLPYKERNPCALTYVESLTQCTCEGT